MKSVFKGFNLDENGKVDGAYPNFQTKIQEQMAIMSKEANEYTMKILSRLNIDPDVLMKQKAEIDRLSFENEQLKQENKRAKVLLKAVLDLLQKQKDSHYVLNLLEATSFYDEAECDGYCLFDDIENFLNNGS